MSTAYRTRNTVRLQERVRSDYGLRVDEQNAVLRGVRILGLRSGNGREFAPAGSPPRAGFTRASLATSTTRPARGRSGASRTSAGGWKISARRVTAA